MIIRMKELLTRRLAVSRPARSSALVIMLFCSLAGDARFGLHVAGAELMDFPGAEWVQRSPEAVGVDAGKLSAAISFLGENSGRDGVRELFIVRNGFLIHAGDSVDKVHGVWSCTKSFTSTCLGLLIGDGKCSLDSKASNWVKTLDAEFAEVTLRHFTTMTSGYRAEGDQTTGSYTHGPSRTPFEPGEPLFGPGEKYAYWDSAMNQFANVLTKIAEEPLDELFKRRIADPIGMNPSAWHWGDFGEIDGIKVNGGSGNNGKHIQISAREMARLGLFFLNNGRWRDERLLSPDWIAQATSVQVPATLPNAWPPSAINGPGVYGFNWWVNAIDEHGMREWPGAPESTFAASGYNNNKMFVIPEWNMVIVRLGLDQSDGKISRRTWGAFLAKVGQAIQDE